jgi:hypothetical protein
MWIRLFRSSRATALRNEIEHAFRHAKIYLGSDTAQTPGSLARQVGNVVSETQIQSSLESFREARLTAEMDGRCLNLAVWRNRAAREQMANADTMQALPEPRPSLNII